MNDHAKMDRLLLIMRLLNAPGGIGLAPLAQQAGITVRSTYRYIRTLRSTGVKVVRYKPVNSHPLFYISKSNPGKSLAAFAPSLPTQMHKPLEGASIRLMSLPVWATFNPATNQWAAFNSISALVQHFPEISHHVAYSKSCKTNQFTCKGITIIRMPFYRNADGG